MRVSVDPREWFSSGATCRTRQDDATREGLGGSVPLQPSGPSILSRAEAILLFTSIGHNMT